MCLRVMRAQGSPLVACCVHSWQAGVKALTGSTRGTISMKKQDMNRNWIATAATLSSALPYLQRYDGAIVVIKLENGFADGARAVSVEVS